MNEKKNRTVTIDGIEITATENLGLYPLTDTGRPPTVMLKGDSLWFGREPSKRPSVTIADSRMSSDHARLERVCADVYRLFDAKSKNGTWHNGSAAEGVIVADQDILRMGNSVFVAAPYLQPVTKAPRSGLLGRSAAIVELRRVCERIGPAEATVLLSGETGTGKEVTAAEIHARSGRSGAFVPVNCGSIPVQLLERELFGHVRGAYTGAAQSGEGFIEAARGGTLFLDEIGELPLDAQSKLLRFLAEKTYNKVGSTTLQRTDVRVIAATNRDLPALVADGRFREDLYARLEQVKLTLPALRERREDLALLLDEAMIRQSRRRFELTADVVEALALYGWPRNVRELFTVIQRIPLMRETDRFELRDLPEEIAAPLTQRLLRAAASGGAPTKSRLASLLKLHQGNVSAVASALDVDRKQVYRWFEQMGLDPVAFRKG